MMAERKYNGLQDFFGSTLTDLIVH